MRIFKRKVLHIVVLLIVTIALSSCGKEAAKSGNTEEERIVVSWASWVTGSVNKNSWLEQELEKEFTDIDFDFWPIERDTYKSQVSLKAAGGDCPDIMYQFERKDVQEYVKMGALTEVPLELVKENCPNIYEASKEFNKSVWLSTEIDGKNYGLPFMNIELQVGISTDGWRKDWLEKVGITKIPETIEEMEEALIRFVDMDPDGNGKKDTYGIISNGRAEGASSFSFDAIYGAFGARPSQWMIQPDGSVRYGVVTEQSKEALKLLSRWYKLGLIDPEYVITDGKAKREKWANGQGGYVDGCTWTRLVAPESEYYTALKAINPDAEIALAPPIKGPEGHSGYNQYNDLSASWVFGRQLRDEPEKLERILQVLDKIAGDDRIFGLFYGEENLHWKRDDNTGVPVYVTDFAEPKHRGDLGTNFSTVQYFGIPRLQKLYKRNDFHEVSRFAKEGSIHEGKDYLNLIRVSIPPEYAMQQQAVQVVHTKWVIDFITGNKDVEADWDAFINEWNAAGGTELTEIANPTYAKIKQEIENINSRIQ